ncbi:MAG: hypothetical protein ACRELU_07265 [Gemmatimonadota bacterium]
MAAYLYLSGWPGHKSARTELVDSSLVMDFSESNEPLGLEIVDPEAVSISEIDGVLRGIDEDPLTPGEVDALRRPKESKDAGKAVDSVRKAPIPESLFAEYGKACHKAQVFHRSMSDVLVMIRILQDKHLTRSELAQIQRDFSESTGRQVARYLTTMRLIDKDARQLFEDAIRSRDQLVHHAGFLSDTVGGFSQSAVDRFSECIALFEDALKASETAKAALEEELGFEKGALEDRIRGYVKEEAERYD